MHASDIGWVKKRQKKSLEVWKIKCGQKLFKMWEIKSRQKKLFKSSDMFTLVIFFSVSFSS